MATTQANFTQQELKTSVIKVFSYENKNIKGTFFNPYYEEARQFENLMQLILLIEDMQDELNIPERTLEKRSLKASQGTGAKQPAPVPGLMTGEVLATFKITMLFRKNASWQGNVTWTEKNISSGFRSSLELILLIDSVLQ